MRAQASFEYIMIVVISVLIVSVGMYLFIGQAREAQYKAVAAKIEVMGNNIVDNALAMYYQGGYSKKTIPVIMPEEVLQITIVENQRIVFRMDTPYGESNMVFFSKVPLKGVLPEAERTIGIRRFILEKKEDSVNICTNIIC